MMILTLIPQLAADGDPPLSLVRAGDTLIVDGVPLDFTVVPPGGAVPCTAFGSPRIAGYVARDTDGTLRVPVILPYADTPPEAGTLTVAADGPVALPTPGAEP